MVICGMEEFVCAISSYPNFQACLYICLFTVQITSLSVYLLRKLLNIVYIYNRGYVSLYYARPIKISNFVLKSVLRYRHHIFINIRPRENVIQQTEILIK